jgi:Cysteine-rich CPCC
MQKYTCPCCGYKTIYREETFYDLCPVCFWETDPIQLADPTYKGGANRPSLAEAQQNFILFGACEKHVFPYVRLPLTDEIRDENWVTFDQNTEGSLFFKRHWNETSGNPKTDDWGTSTYYFETTKSGEVLKQIVVCENGKTLKYSKLNEEDEFGGLSEVHLDLTDSEYGPLSIDAFFELWNTPLIETFTAQKIHLAGWHIAVYNAEVNSFRTKLIEDEKLISATLDHRFMLDLSFQKGLDHFPRNGFYLLEIKEGHTGVHYFTYMNWDEAAAATQKLIDEVEAANKVVDARKEEEAKVFDVRVIVDNQLIMSKLTTWRNMDWDVEKFRNIELKVGEETFSIIDTFTDFENMLIALKRSLPENYRVETCLFCRFSSYNPVGNDNFGALDCFKNCKKAFEKVDEKHALFALHKQKKAVILKVEETHYCTDFQAIKAGDWVYKHVV